MANPDSPAFQRAFAAVSYLVGRRGDELLDALGDPREAALGVARSLAHSEREKRAAALARELALISAALEARVIR